LEPERARAVGDHLRGCVECWEQYEKIRTGINLLRQLPLHTPPPSLLRATQQRVAQVRQQMARRAGSWSALRRAVAVAGLACVVGLGFASYLYNAYSTEDAAAATLQRLARQVESQELLPWLEQVETGAQERRTFAYLKLILQEIVNVGQHAGFESHHLAFLRERILRGQLLSQLRALAQAARGERRAKLSAALRICEALCRSAP